MGTIIPDRFEPIRFLRKDRTCWTFVATDHRLGRNEVLVKVIGKGVFSSDTSRLIDVFSWYRGLRHSLISDVLDAGLTPKRDLFLVRTYLPASEFFTAANTDSLKALVSAIDFLNSKGRVHGAIKPSNLFASDGIVRISDPWAWNRHDSKQSLTEENIRFSAPEVLAGGDPTVDSDLYSLGALLYRFYSGRDPFEDSDLESLKAKYIWASPRPLASVSHVSKAIAEVVTNLLAKNPNLRRSGFQSLKDELNIEFVPASRAPAFGLSAGVDHVFAWLAQKPTLTVTLVEGPAGAGKSRFVEELLHRASFAARAFTPCETSIQSPYASLSQRILSVIDGQKLAAGAAVVTRLRNFVASGQEPVGRVELEEVHRDLGSALTSVCRQIRMLLVIEDIDRASRKMVGLIEMLLQRIGDLELSIVVTARTGGLASNITRLLKESLGEDFHRVTVGMLGTLDSETLSSFFSNDPDCRTHAERHAGGNPSFVEEYCRNGVRAVAPKRVRNALSGLILRLPKPLRRVAEVLSLFEHPVDWECLSQVSGMSELDLRECVGYLEALGLVRSDGLSIRYPDARMLLHSKIPRSRRMEWHAQSFWHLQRKGSDNAVLADHAFRGALFDIAGTLYLQLARDTFSRKDFGTAARCYAFVAECRSKNPTVSPLSPGDNVTVAKCAAHQGDKRNARKILEQLLASKAVQEDCELLSSVYATLASPLLEDSPEERIRLLGLAIDCLDADSPQMLHRYRALAVAFLSAGNPREAERVLQGVERYCNSLEEFQQFDDVRASVLMNQGNFKEAAACLQSRQFLWSTPGGVSNNLAVCLEQLGDLRRARELQALALKQAEFSGSLYLEGVYLNNLGAMETKLGNIEAAAKLFASSLGKFRAGERQSSLPHTRKLGDTYADIASHFLQKGEYRKALLYLGRINSDHVCPFPLERFFVAMSRCELHIELGQLSLVSSVLEMTRRMPLNGEFFEIERLLIEVRLHEPSYELRDRLKDAMGTCGRLETLYQETRVRLALARMLLSVGDQEGARGEARIAWNISRDNAYKLLSVRAQLIVGLTAERESDKEFAFRSALDAASEMGLAPLAAECALEIGSWRLNCRSYAEARDYLAMNASITTRLADDLTRSERRSYLSRQDLTKARVLLNEASARASDVRPNGVVGFLNKDAVLFACLYRLAAAMTAAGDTSSALEILVKALKEAVKHPTVVVSGTGSKAALHSVRGCEGLETEQRIADIASASGDKPYITGLITGRRRGTAVWMPILSLAMRGGIYIECAPGESGIYEQEIEFLTIVSAIAGAAFDRVCSKTSVPSICPTDLQFQGIVGSSRQIQKVYAQIEIAAANAANVLIEGESGTGKELVAKGIHERSERARAPFVPIDCGALPEGLIEAEMFGAKKGAYTGAVADRQGLFEAANHGTIFLDEISNLGLAAQAKLLRVLQEREVRRIGSMTGKPVDVRLIAATNCNLERLVREGRFRQDLLYRLKVLHILLPPLRDRKTDVPLLATAFLERLNNSSKTRKYFGPRVMEKLLDHNYPGNVRELQNAVERSFYSTSGAVITQVDFLRGPNSIDSPEPGETESWFKDLTEGRQNFWAAVHDRYKRRDISRERVVALVDFGLRTTRGNYKTMASMLQIPKEEYHRFMDFLRRSQCLLDFRPYRRAADIGE